MRFTRLERKQFVQTRAVRWVPRSSIRTACKFGSQRRLVLFIAWLTLLPAIGPLPQTSHLLAITGELYHASATRRNGYDHARRACLRPVRCSRDVFLTEISPSPQRSQRFSGPRRRHRVEYVSDGA